MESEGPYKLVGGVFDGPNGFNFRIVWGPDFKLDSKIIHEEIIKIANQAHAEGRKSMEKDFKELLEMMKYVVDRIGDSGQFGQMHALEKLMAWKKARGIE